MKPNNLIIVALFVSAMTVNAQKGAADGSKYGHGEDSIRCLTNLSLYTEYFKQKSYSDAFPYWEIVFNECPLSQMSLYPNGAVIIKSFLDKETDAAKKDELYNYLLKVHDQRIQYFGTNSKYPKAYILGIKAVDMLKYKKDDLATSKQAYALLNDAVTGRGAQTDPAVLITHMSNAASLYKAKEITAEEIVTVYTSVSEIIDAQIANKPDNDENGKLDETKAAIEKLFVATGAADCETIQQIFSPQFEKNATNVAWLKRVSNLQSKQECANDLVFKVSESLHKIEPSANSARGLAVMCLKNKETDKAITYYKQAVELEQNQENKGTLNYTLGIIYMSQDNYAQARTYFQRASELRPGWGLPYIQIGILYGSSAKSCGKDEFEQKGVYWAAIDKFSKAKTVDPTIADEANKQIATYSAHFPSKEDIFFHGMTEGSAYTVGCWINETTTIRAKKQ